ncbi:hypothetical protein HMI55_001540 [Coelomomyces lativittatus]|nr:hypothetical protein HMI56_004622 [Coelomomyces lativittatus]KAJ1505585.1 hypothetical protein HMI55_001540 [Coelomomyces lativittatus]
MLKHKDLYAALAGREQQLLDRGKIPANEFIDVIERDLHRTFPDNLHYRRVPVPNAPVPPFVSTTWLITSLRNVLVAFSFYCPEIGYCQSMNYIVGLLLLFHSEEEAFWMLVVITEDLLPPNLYTKNLLGTVTEMKVFHEIFKQKCRGIVSKVQAGGIVDLDMLICPWFLTIYINILPIESVLRVWDCFF